MIPIEIIGITIRSDFMELVTKRFKDGETDKRSGITHQIVSLGHLTEDLVGGCALWYCLDSLDLSKPTLPQAISSHLIL